MSTPEHYQQQLAALAPPGSALPAKPDSSWMKLLRALGIEFSRVHGRIEDLRGEITLTTTRELLDEWEKAVLPSDTCLPAAATDAQRLERIRAKLAEQGGQSVPYMVGLASNYGIAITVDEDAAPFEIGVHGMGAPVGGYAWRYVWTVHVNPPPPASVRTILECVLGNVAPADRILKFRYGSEPVCGPVIRFDGSVNYDGLVAYATEPCLIGPFYNGAYDYDGEITYGAES